MNTFLLVLIRVSTGIVLLPLIAALVKRKGLSQAQRWFAWILLVVFIIQTIATIMTMGYGLSNLPLYHLYTAIEGSFLIVLLARFFNDSIVKKVAYITAAFFAVFTIVNAFWIQGLYELPTYSRSIEGITLTLLAFAYFFKVMREVKIKRLHHTFLFWVVSGILIYFPSNLMLFIFDKFLYQTDQYVVLAVWGTHGGINILLYLAYTIAFLCKDQKS